MLRRSLLFVACLVGCGGTPEAPPEELAVGPTGSSTPPRGSGLDERTPAVSERVCTIVGEGTKGVRWHSREVLRYSPDDQLIEWRLQSDGYHLHPPHVVLFDRDASGRVLRLLDYEWRHGEIGPGTCFSYFGTTMRSATCGVTDAWDDFELDAAGRIVRFGALSFSRDVEGGVLSASASGRPALIWTEDAEHRPVRLVSTGVSYVPFQIDWTWKDVDRATTVDAVVQPANAITLDAEHCAYAFDHTDSLTGATCSGGQIEFSSSIYETRADGSVSMRAVDGSSTYDYGAPCRVELRRAALMHQLMRHAFDRLDPRRPSVTDILDLPEPAVELPPPTDSE